MSRKFFPKPLDFLFIFLSIFAIIFSIFRIKGGQENSAKLIIDSPDKEFVYPMDKDMELTVEGEIGTSVIKIEGGKAFFVDSPCPNHICVQTPALRSNNDWAACMPNGIFIRIEGGKDFDSSNYLEDFDNGEN